MDFKVEGRDGSSIEWESKGDKEIKILTGVYVLTGIVELSKDDAKNLITALSNFIDEDEYSCECEIETEDMIEIEVDGCCCISNYESNNGVIKIEYKFNIHAFVKNVISSVNQRQRLRGFRWLVPLDNEDVVRWLYSFSMRSFWTSDAEFDYYHNTILPTFVNIVTDDSMEVSI